MIVGDDDYILYVAQEANFQTRSMLIHAKSFMKSNTNDYNLLKQYAVEKTYTIDGNDYHVKGLLFENFIFEKNIGHPVPTPYSEICNKLTMYADSPDFCDDNDRKWYEKSFTNICAGFNHIKNYCESLKISSYQENPINIIDSFLILELENGKYKKPSFDTVKELQIHLIQDMIEKFKENIQ